MLERGHSEVGRGAGKNFRGNDTAPETGFSERSRAARRLGRGFLKGHCAQLEKRWTAVQPDQAQACQGGQLAPDRSTQEAGIAHLHKSLRENMLEETLKKLLDRKRTLFELSGIGSTILRGDLRTFHGTAIVKSQQAAIADGHPMNIGSQILEGGLTIAKEGASLLTFLTDFSSVSESGIILVAGSADGHAYVPDFTKEECEAYPLIA